MADSNPNPFFDRKLVRIPREKKVRSTFEPAALKSYPGAGGPRRDRHVESSLASRRFAEGGTRTVSPIFFQSANRKNLVVSDFE